MSSGGRKERRRNDKRPIKSHDVSEHGWIEIVSLVLGGACALRVLQMAKAKGIGPQTLMALALCLLAPIVLILGMEKILSSETIAAIVGAMVGLGAQSIK